MTAEDRSKMSVMLTSRDTKAATRFYIQKLGFEMKESWPSADDPQWANLVMGGQSVMVGSAPDPKNLESMCQGDEATLAYWKKSAEDFAKHKAGVGIQVYVMVDDVDAYHAEIVKRGAKPETEPKSQFYGIRDFGVNDLDGYRLVFFSPITLSTCQSCGMPLQDAEPGQMYCQYCTNDKGELKPYEQVFEGTVQGFFMAMQKMPRDKAEAAAKEHLAKMPAWAGQ
jgi:uncharacterized glyoxalase superfamily protein PhnB